MLLSFENFQFDCQQQLLLKNGHVIPLNEKPTQLLALFLSDTNKIYSKADILQIVWPDKVVSDQVVFQNISLLRSLFGNHAIKTYTKKGYQWQLSLHPVSAAKTPAETSNKQSEVNNIKYDMTSAETQPAHIIETDEKSAGSNSKPTAKNKISISKPLTIFSVVMTIILFFVLLWFFNQQSINHSEAFKSPDRTATSAINNNITAKIDAILDSNPDIKSLSQDKQLNHALFDSPFQTWHSFSHFDKQLLFSYKLYPISGKTNVTLRFYLQGKQRGWQGYIVDTPVNSIVDQLTQFLKILLPTPYFILESDNAALAQLTLLHETHPENSLIIRQLAHFHDERRDFDIANALVDSALNSETTNLYIGLLHLLKVNINTRDANWTKAEKHITQAQSVFQELQLPHLESLTLVQSAWIDFVHQSYSKSREKVNTAANKARIAEEPLLEINAHLTQSFMAAKIKENALMHSQLDLAKQLFTLHGLNQEHQISVLSNIAWSAKDSSEALPNYQKILATPFSKLYRYEFYLAAENVRKTLIDKQLFKQALQSIKPWQRDSFQMVTRAQVAFAQKQWKIATKLADKAFTTARLAHEKYDALDAALLMLIHQQHLPQNDKFNEYKIFIAQNASKRWSRINQALLAELEKQ